MKRDDCLHLKLSAISNSFKHKQWGSYTEFPTGWEASATIRYFGARAFVLVRMKGSAPCKKWERKKEQGTENMKQKLYKGEKKSERNTRRTAEEHLLQRKRKWSYPVSQRRTGAWISLEMSHKWNRQKTVVEKKKKLWSGDSQEHSLFVKKVKSIQVFLTWKKKKQPALV